MIEPISVCELDAGRPSYQVPRFQMIAEARIANTIAAPAPDPTWMTSSTGSSATIPKATAPFESSTPVRFMRPDHTTASGRRHRAGVDDRGHGVGRVVEAVDALERKCETERKYKRDNC